MGRTVITNGKDYYIFMDLGDCRYIREKTYNTFTKTYTYNTTNNISKEYGNYIYKKLIKAGFKRIEEGPEYGK